MVREKKAATADSEKPARKSKLRWHSPDLVVALTTLFSAKSTGGRAKGKLTPYNKFMKQELARLKDADPDVKHADRYVMTLLQA